MTNMRIWQVQHCAVSCLDVARSPIGYRLHHFASRQGLPGGAGSPP
jgi:hypothetical protein